MKNKLDDLIYFLGNQFLNINTLWLNHSNYEKINMKKNLVSDIYTQENIIKTIRGYQSFLIESTIGLNLTLENEYNAISRVKTPNSIEDKIRRFNSSNYEYGKIPICKCLNDLFGARIVLKEELSFCEIYGFLENKDFLKDISIRLKCRDSSKDGYKATHIYFIKEKDNSVFQWELQIWAEKDARNNTESHSKYKQEYTKWENEISTEKEG